MRRSIAFILILLLCSSVAMAANDASQGSEYRLQSSDVIGITVHGQPDLTTKTRLTSDGFITFPLLGKVHAQGLAVQELEQKLKELLEKDYLVKAEVIVFIEEYHPRQVSVMGEVNKPGKFAITGEKDLTLMQAIAMAEGFSKHADITKTKIMRVENGEKKTIIINVKDITEKSQKDKDIVLQPEDVVYASESFF